MTEKVQAAGAGVLAAAEAELFKALAHPARARVLGVLVAGPATVPELCDATGLKPSHLAGHLTQLRAQHLVTGTRSGGRLFYGLSFPEVARILSAADSVLAVRAGAAAGGLAGTGATAVPHAAEEVTGTFPADLLPTLEQSVQARALVDKAVESLSLRTGSSPDAVHAALLAEARRRDETLTQVARDSLGAPD